MSYHRRKRPRLKGTKKPIQAKTWCGDPSHWRRMLNRIFRAKSKQAMRDGDDPGALHPKKRNDGYYW